MMRHSDVVPRPAMCVPFSSAGIYPDLRVLMLRATCSPTDRSLGCASKGQGASTKHESTSSANRHHTHLIPISPVLCIPPLCGYVTPYPITSDQPTPNHIGHTRQVSQPVCAWYCFCTLPVPFGGVLHAAGRPQSHERRRCEAGLSCDVLLLLRSSFGRVRCSVGEMHALRCGLRLVWRWECDRGDSGARSGIAYLIVACVCVCACQMYAFLQRSADGVSHAVGSGTCLSIVGDVCLELFWSRKCT